MTTVNLVSLVTGVLILAVIVPIALSIWLATNRAKYCFIPSWITTLPAC